jgi:hypothetical protein
MRKAALLLLLTALAIATAWFWLANQPSDVENEVSAAARAGSFPSHAGYPYDGQVDCRVAEPNAFHGHDIFLCKLGLKGLEDLGGQYVYVALINGELHTHDTDPDAIPGRAFDPGF